jgi:hypothetical protein
MKHQRARGVLRGTPKPHTTLGKLQDFAPSILTGGPRSADSFVLLLALVYNDLRELLWIVDRVNAGEPSKIDISTETGDWQGAIVWTKRVVTSSLNELLVAVKHATKIIESMDFERTIVGLSAAEQQAWRDIVDVALERRARASEIRTFFDRVRNRAGFHYDRAQLWNGYTRHFHELPPNQFNTRGYLSIGPTIAATRFYFADAAAQQALDLFDPKGDLWPMVNAVIRRVNLALRAIVAEHLRRRHEAAEQAGMHR